MKSVKILKPWICCGKNPPIGSVVELDDSLAKSGSDRGLCKIVDKSTDKPKASAKTGRKRKTAN